MPQSTLTYCSAAGIAVVALLSGCAGADTKSGSKSEAKIAPQVQVLQSGFGQNGKYVQGIAVVKSDSPDAVGRSVTASANFEDAAGKVIATQEQVESFSWPNQELVLPIWLDLSSSGPDTKVASIDVSVAASDYSIGNKSELKPLPVLDSDGIQPNPYGGFTTSFMFTNETGSDLKNLRVGVVCYDATGAIIGGAFIFPDLAPAGKPIRLESTLTVSGEPKNCKAYPNYGI